MTAYIPKENNFIKKNKTEKNNNNKNKLLEGTGRMAQSVKPSDLMLIPRICIENKAWWLMVVFPALRSRDKCVCGAHPLASVVYLVIFGPSKRISKNNVGGS